MFLALALALPAAFHAAGLGSSFLPMFYPLVMAGFIIDWPVSAAVGFLAPLASAVLTGMPPFYPPIAFIMAVEGVVLTGIPAFLYRKRGLAVLPVLLIALLCDRVVLFAAAVLVSRWIGLPGDVLGPASVIHGLPGLALIIAVLPTMIRKVEKRIKRLPAME